MSCDDKHANDLYSGDCQLTVTYHGLHATAARQTDRQSGPGDINEDASHIMGVPSYTMQRPAGRARRLIAASA